jgi:hypothetical protein
VQLHLDHCPCPFCRPSQVDVGPLLYIASGHVPDEDRDVGSNARSQALHQFRRQVLGTVYQLKCWCPCCTRLAGRRVRCGCCMPGPFRWPPSQGPRLLPVAITLRSGVSKECCPQRAGDGVGCG